MLRRYTGKSDNAKENSIYLEDAQFPQKRMKRKLHEDFNTSRALEPRELGLKFDERYRNNGLTFNNGSQLPSFPF